MEGGGLVNIVGYWETYGESGNKGKVKSTGKSDTQRETWKPNGKTET